MVAHAARHGSARPDAPAVNDTLRIADVTQWYSPTSGGIRTYLHAKADYAARARTPHALIVTRGAAAVGAVGTSRVTDVRGWTLPGHWGYHVAPRSRGIIAALEEFGPTVIILHDATAFPQAIAQWASRRAVTVVVMCHSHLADAATGLPRAVSVVATPILERIQRRATRVGDRVIVASEATRQQLVEHARSPIIVSRLGVDVAAFASATPNPELHARLAGSGRLLIYAGRLSPEKHVTSLPDVLAALPDAYSLVVAGSGISADAIRRRARAAGVTERLHMVGHVTDRGALASLMATADCFVHPNANEPFGLAPLEAAVAGCRVVIPSRAGAAGVLARGGGTLVDDDAPDTLARGVHVAMRAARPRLRPSDVSWRPVFDREWRLYGQLRR
jgi:alpha-1,6-mannosyltransferase